jgi:hypothetical protein
VLLYSLLSVQLLSFLLGDMDGGGDVNHYGVLQISGVPRKVPGYATVVSVTAKFIHVLCDLVYVDYVHYSRCL